MVYWRKALIALMRGVFLLATYVLFCSIALGVLERGGIEYTQAFTSSVSAKVAPDQPGILRTFFISLYRASCFKVQQSLAKVGRTHRRNLPVFRARIKIFAPYEMQAVRSKNLRVSVEGSHSFTL